MLAFCEDVAASGGYWLACAADEIYAHPTSLVGSIGVISQGFGLDGLIERFGVERGSTPRAGRSRASTRSCRRSRRTSTWLRGLQDQLHTMFADWVRERRGDRLTPDDTELFDGEVWTGAHARSSWAWSTAWAPPAACSPSASRTPTCGPVESRKPLLARLGLGASAAGVPLGRRGPPDGCSRPCRR